MLCLIWDVIHNCHVSLWFFSWCRHQSRHFNGYKYKQLSFKLMTAYRNWSTATAHFSPFPNVRQVPWDRAPHTTKYISYKSEYKSMTLGFYKIWTEMGPAIYTHSFLQWREFNVGCLVIRTYKNGITQNKTCYLPALFSSVKKGTYIILPIEQADYALLRWNYLCLVLGKYPFFLRETS